MQFNCHIIYSIYLKDQNKVIQVKDLQIYKNIIPKIIIALSDFNNTLTFNVVQIPAKQMLFQESNIFKKEKSI